MLASPMISAGQQRLFAACQILQCSLTNCEASRHHLPKFMLRVHCTVNHPSTSPHPPDMEVEEVAMQAVSTHQQSLCHISPEGLFGMGGASVVARRLSPLTALAKASACP